MNRERRVFKSSEGKPLEERVNFLEKTLNAVAIKRHKQTNVFIPPTILSNCIFGDDIKDEIFNIFLFKGKLIQLIIDIGIKPKNKTRLFLNLSNNKEAITKILVLDKKVCGLDLDLETKNLDNLSLVIKKEEEEENITEENKKDKIKRVSFSILWQGDIAKAAKESFLIDELLKDGFLIEE